MAEAYEQKRVETGEEGVAVLERVVLLRVIDSLWVEHLTAVDDMRRGIGLRAYSQRDPLNEFKVEAYRMFDELKDTIRHDVTHTIFRVSVARRAGRAADAARDRGTPGARRAPAARRRSGGRRAATERAGRPPAGRQSANGPAGAARKKFKQCHGARVGPKVGPRTTRAGADRCKKFKRCHGA